MAGVVAGYDGSEPSAGAVRWALHEARSRDCPLLLVWAIPVPVTAVEFGLGAVGVPGWPAGAGPGWGVAAEDDPARTQAREALTALAADCQATAPEVEVSTAVETGRPALVLARAADRVDAACVVLGSTGHGALPRMLLGSTAAELVHDSAHPVIVVRGERGNGPVVVGVECTEASDLACAFAFEFAARHGRPLLAVHAGEQPAAQHLERWRERHPTVSLTVEVVQDSPSAALLERSHGAWLLVVGSRRHGAIRRVLLGSVSHAALYHAACPVAVVPTSEGAEDG